MSTFQDVEEKKAVIELKSRYEYLDSTVLAVDGYRWRVFRG